MRNRKNYLSIVLVFMMVITSVVALPEKAFASYAKDTYFNWDITGDGKSEKISFKLDETEEYDVHYTLYVYINDKKALTMNTDYYFITFDYKKLELENGKRFLLISTKEENGYGERLIYQYKKGKLTEVVNLRDVAGAELLEGFSTKGNTVTFTMTCPYAAGIGLSEFETVYTYAGGTLKLKNKVHKITSYGNVYGYSDNAHPTTVPIQIYSDKKCKNKSKIIPVGTNLKVTKMFTNKSFISYYVTGEGYEGWYSFEDMVCEMMPIMIFDEVFCAG